MRFIGNVLWLLFGGFFSGLSWLVAGVLCCLTIIGIPLGLQCFKFSSLAFAPFGKEIQNTGGTISFLANVLWLLILGIPMAIENFILGLLLCCTIIGIPFGIQFFKIASLSLAPFGKDII